MRVKALQTVAARKQETKLKFQLGRFLWKARVIKLFDFLTIWVASFCKEKQVILQEYFTRIL